MKKMIVIFGILLTLIAGCSENLQVNGPEYKNTTSGPNWITLPQNSGASVEAMYSVTGEINGALGGQLFINEIYYAGPFGLVKVSAKLRFPRNCFSGTETITMMVDNVNGTVTYSPSMTFDTPALLDLEFTGLDFTGIDPDSISFVYMDPDGTFAAIVYKEIIVDLANGKITLRDGAINHFSRYGFSR